MNMIFPRQEVTHLFETCDETLYWARLAAKCAERGHEGCRRAFDWNEVAPGKSKLDGNWQMGVADGIPWAHDEDELVSFFMHDAVDPDTGEKLTFDELCEKGPITYSPMETWRQYYVYKQTNPETGKPYGFQRTTSLKCEPYAEGMIRLGRTGHVSGK